MRTHSNPSIDRRLGWREHGTEGGVERSLSDSEERVTGAGALLMMHVPGADIPMDTLVKKLRQSVSASMNVATAHVAMVPQYSSSTTVAGGAGVADAVVVLVVPVVPDDRPMTNLVVENAEASLLSLVTDRQLLACHEPTMLWASTFHGDSSVYVPDSRIESDTIMAEVPLADLPQQLATPTLANEIAVAVAAAAGRPSSDVDVAFLLDSDGAYTESVAVSAHLTIRYPLADLERARVASTAITMASQLRRDATPIFQALPALTGPEYMSEWVHYFRGKEYVARMRLALPRVSEAQLADAAWVTAATAALERSMAQAAREDPAAVVVTNWTKAADTGEVNVDVLLADSKSHFNQHVTVLISSDGWTSPVDTLAHLAATDANAMLNASLPGMTRELRSADIRFVSTGDLHQLPPPKAAEESAAAGNTTLSFGVMVLDSMYRIDQMDLSALGGVLTRRLAHQGGVDEAAVEMEWTVGFSSQCTAAQFVTMSFTAVQYPGCAMAPLATWANRLRTAPKQFFAPIVAPFTDDAVRPFS
jgi:hypothetical protein